MRRENRIEELECTAYCQDKEIKRLKNSIAEIMMRQRKYDIGDVVLERTVTEVNRFELEPYYRLIDSDGNVTHWSESHIADRIRDNKMTPKKR